MSKGGSTEVSERELTDQELALLEQQSGFIEISGDVLQQQLSATQQVRDAILRLSPSDAELEELRAINSRMIANGQAVLANERRIISAQSDLLPQQIQVMGTQLDLYQANLDLVGMQTQAALTTEPARQVLLAGQIGTQIQNVGVTSQQLDLQSKLTGFNANEVFEFTKQNLSAQQSIDETQFANIQLSQTGDERQQTIFNELLPKNETFQVRQFELAAQQQGLTEDQIAAEKSRLGLQEVFNEEQFRLAAKEQGLSDGQIDFAANKLGLEAARLTVEERQLALSSGLFDVQALSLAQEIASGKGLLESSLESLGLEQSEAIRADIAAGKSPIEAALQGLVSAQIEGAAAGITGEVPANIRNKEKEEIDILKQELANRGIEVSGDKLEELTTGDTVGIQQIEAFKRGAQERRLQAAGQSQTALQQSLSALGQERSTRIGLSQITPATQALQGQSGQRLGLTGANVGSPFQIAQNVAGIGIQAPGSFGISQGIQPGQFNAANVQGLSSPQFFQSPQQQAQSYTQGGFQQFGLPTINQQFNNPLAQNLGLLNAQLSGFTQSGSLAASGAQAASGGLQAATSAFTPFQQPEGSGDTIGSTLGGIASIGSLFTCWVAAAIYGRGTMEFLKARHWITLGWQGRIADGFRYLYLRYGQRFAKVVEKNKFVRMLVKPFFDRAVVLGARDIGGEHGIL
ncbi:hypothetical protein CL629_03425 [bacterium]|nr:hypothetical protein [bacterium]|tara:strand:- start:14462 stop:16531 length:2070 start_codon:yes stop_codon:yes gene_type:complete